MRPFSTFSTVVPVNRIVLPVPAGSGPNGMSSNASPVWVPPPSHWPTTESPSAIRSAVPQKFRSGNAARNVPANARTASRPRSGSCSEYSNRMSGAASSSMTAGLKSLPQNSANHRPTTALFSSIDISRSLPCGELSAALPQGAHPADARSARPVRWRRGISRRRPDRGGLPEACRRAWPARWTRAYGAVLRWAVLGDFPQVGVAVAIGGRQQLAIRAERNPENGDSAGVFEDGQLVSGPRVPQVGAAVAITRCQPLAVLAERHRPDAVRPGLSIGEDGCLVFGRHIP